VPLYTSRWPPLSLQEMTTQANTPPVAIEFIDTLQEIAVFSLSAWLRANNAPNEVANLVSIIEELGMYREAVEAGEEESTLYRCIDTTVIETINIVSALGANFKGPLTISGEREPLKWTPPATFANWLATYDQLPGADKEEARAWVRAQVTAENISTETPKALTHEQIEQLVADDDDPLGKLAAIEELRDRLFADLIRNMTADAKENRRKAIVSLQESMGRKWTPEYLDYEAEENNYWAKRESVIFICGLMMGSASVGGLLLQPVPAHHS